MARSPVHVAPSFIVVAAVAARILIEPWVAVSSASAIESVEGLLQGVCECACVCVWWPATCAGRRLRAMSRSTRDRRGVVGCLSNLRMGWVCVCPKKFALFFPFSFSQCRRTRAGLRMRGERGRARVTLFVCARLRLRVLQWLACLSVCVWCSQLVGSKGFVCIGALVVEVQRARVASGVRGGQRAVVSAWKCARCGAGARRCRRAVQGGSAQPARRWVASRLQVPRGVRSARSRRACPLPPL